MREADPPEEPRLNGFYAIVAENLKALCLAQRDALMAVARDPRCARRHAHVLTEIIAHTNKASGVAYPGPTTLARSTGYSYGVVRNIISDLLLFGYLASIQRAPAGGGRAVAHYTITKPTAEHLQKTRPKPARDDGTRAMTKARVTTAHDTKSKPGITGAYDTRSSGVIGVDEPGVIGVGGTLTRRGTRRKNPPVLANGADGDPGVTIEDTPQANGKAASAASSEPSDIQQPFRINGIGEPAAPASRRRVARDGLSLAEIEAEAGFQKFWAAYRRKVAKPAAKKTFIKIVLGKQGRPAYHHR
jgi:hypothetical protein